MSSDNCIFCKIIKGEIPCYKIAEGEKFLAFMDINPLSKGHCLVIPKFHCEKLHQLPPEDMVEVGPAIVKIAKAIGEENYNILQNNGSIAHQVVKHVHFHIIPKPSYEQGLGIRWPSFQMEQSELKKISEEIKGRL